MGWRGREKCSEYRETHRMESEGVEGGVMLLVEGVGGAKMKESGCD